jgi:hypothetical protein
MTNITKHESNIWRRTFKITQYRIVHTDKKEKQIFLIYKEIQSGAVAKSYMRKGFLIYEEMRKYFPIYEEATLQLLHSEFPYI